MPTEPTIRHFMLPGSHEFPRIPRCNCGFEWDWWNDCCTADTGDAPAADDEEARDA